MHSIVIRFSATHLFTRVQKATPTATGGNSFTTIPTAVTSWEHSQTPLHFTVDTCGTVILRVLFPEKEHACYFIVLVHVDLIVFPDTSVPKPLETWIHCCTVWSSPYTLHQQEQLITTGWLVTTDIPPLEMTLKYEWIHIGKSLTVYQHVNRAYLNWPDQCSDIPSQEICQIQGY